jgi:hypothetical protein
MRDRTNRRGQAVQERLLAEVVHAMPVPMAVVHSAQSVVYANRAFAVLADKPVSSLKEGTIPIPDHLLATLQSGTAGAARWTAPGGQDCRLLGVPVGEALGLVVLEGSTAPDDAVLKRAAARLRDLERRLAHDPAAAAALREIASELDPEQGEHDSTPQCLHELIAGVLDSRTPELAGHGIAVQLRGGIAPGYEVPARMFQSLLEELLSQAVLELTSRPEPRALRLTLSGGTEDSALIRLTHNGEQQPGEIVEARAAAAGADLSVIVAGRGLGVTYVLEFTRN